MLLPRNTPGTLLIQRCTVNLELTIPNLNRTVSRPQRTSAKLLNVDAHLPPGQNIMTGFVAMGRASLVCMRSSFCGPLMHIFLTSSSWISEGSNVFSIGWLQMQYRMEGMTQSRSNSLAVRTTVKGVRSNGGIVRFWSRLLSI